MRRTVAVATCLILGACATGQRAATSTALPGGYLEEAALDRLAAHYSPTSLTAALEQSESEQTGPGTDRWWLAIAHAELRLPEAAQHFDCVLGTRLAGRPRPALTRLMTRLLVDSDRLTQRLAQAHPRPRPIAVNRQLQPCQRIDDATRDTPSWPAGAAMAGAAWGEAFAGLAPDRAGALRVRGHDIGVSRAICRMHWGADVVDGALIGAAVYRQAALSPGFTTDLEAARAELAAARAEGLTHPGCAAERRALSPGADQAGRGATSEP